MIGTLGTPEMFFIFILALVLFGPKKLPELGRTVGKALTEFRRASSELKSTFDRELRTLEAETNLKEVQNDLQLDTYNYDYSSYEHHHDESYVPETYESTAEIPSIEGASATEDAESLPATAPEGVIARGSESEASLQIEEHPSTTPPPTSASE